ncbi:hypothetical protein [Neotabrizicola sp. VNH66]|uniref:hypothetical protein n=1 Tax=Neotabrizicola sp. VNH66 TaxID=3400918 RepID=UPI003C023F07
MNRADRRTAIVHTPGAQGAPDLVSLPREPWEPDHVPPDPREETRPRQPLIRNRSAGPRVRRVGGWVQEIETGVMDGGGFA